MVDVVREIDDNFLIPDGLKDTGFAETVGDEFAVDPDTIDIQFESIDDGDSELDEDEIGNDLETPENITVITQEVRTAPDGRQVVDIVLEVSDVPGAMKYDVRITKEDM